MRHVGMGVMWQSSASTPSFQATPHGVPQLQRMTEPRFYRSQKLTWPLAGIEIGVILRVEKSTGSLEASCGGKVADGNVPFPPA